MDTSFNNQNRIRRRLLQSAASGVAVGIMSPLCRANTFGDSLLKGAGSTFVMPLVQRWTKEYREDGVGTEFVAHNSGLDTDLWGGAALDYEAAGSLAGLQRLQARAVDFALSELPMSQKTLTRLGLIQIPIVLGGVAIVTRLQELTRPLRLDGATLVSIFRGRISRWNDPAIVALNPDVNLPDLTIMPIYRTEGSGTTYTLTRYLGTQDSAWSRDVGVDALVRWPVGVPARGSSGMAQALLAQTGGIGYLDAVQAASTGLNIAALANSAGQFVTPGRAAIEAAAQGAARQIALKNEPPQLVNAPGDHSYPITATVLAILNAGNKKRGDRRARTFLKWALSHGQQSAFDMGYVPLPPSIVEQVRAML